MGINILIVDDHQTVRDGLKFIFSQEAAIGPIEEAENGREAIIKASKSQPGVVVLDYEMPNFNGIDTAKELLKLQPGIRVLMLSLYNDKEHVFEAIQAGVKGYVTKDSPTSEVIDAIKSISLGDTWFRGEIAELITPYLVESASGHTPLRTENILTHREKEIVRLVATGSRSSDVAEKLRISKRTVEVHRANILKKLNLKNSSELILYAVYNKLIAV